MTGDLLDLCKNNLIYVLRKDYSLTSQISKLTRDSWGDSKEKCIQAFGGKISVVSKFVQGLDANEIIYGNKDVPFSQELFGQNTTGSLDTGTVTSQQLPAQTNQASSNSSKTIIDKIKGFSLQNFTQSISQAKGSDLLASVTQGAKTVGWYTVMFFLVIIGTIFFIKITKYLFEFFYDVFNSRRIVYLKILQPRGESKLEREREKEIAKDMKEKIGRMSQVYSNLHNLGELSFTDSILTKLFNKPKITLITSFENGTITFIMGVYPEHKKIVEGAISAQYSDASIEITAKPKFFSKKYSDIVPLEPSKDPVYPIRVFKQLEDDPLNNIYDSIGKVSSEDTFHIVIPIKPVGESFNKRAKRFADALYRKDKTVLLHTAWRKYFLMPWKIITFLVSGPNREEAKKQKEGGSDPMVRMLKSEEDALNVMGEEASKVAFESGLLLLTSSDNKKRTEENISNMFSTYSIYRDEYNNELQIPQYQADLMGGLFKPLRRFAANFHLTNFFFKENIFTVNQLTSLFHLPDGVFNRSPIIKWTDYKALAAPDNIPVMKDYSGYILTGGLAEDYKKGNLSDILVDYNDWSVGEKEDKVDRLEPIEKYSETQLKDKEIVEKGGKKFVKEFDMVKKKGFKVFKDGVFLGVNVYRNKFSPVYMKRADRLRHHYIIGKSGTGKSVFIQAMARQDIWNGDGICVIDPHGDLVDDIMAYVPKERAKDIIYFDAGNEDRPMGLNLYEIDNYDQADRVVNDATEIFIKMFGPEIFGPRIQEYFKYGSLTLLADFDDLPTLLDVPRLFTDDTYREIKVKKVTNPVVRNFWEKTYNAMGDREKQEIIPYFTSKFVSFNTNRLIRNIIGQTKSAFNFREVMDSGKVLLINLSKGKIGEINAQLLGMIMVSQINNAAMARANVPEKDRRDFFLYVDEFQNFVSGTFADILSEARKYHLGLIMAHQFIAQLEPAKGLGGDGGGKGDVKAAVFGNVGTMMSFKVGAPDAEFLEKEYSPVLAAQDIVGISNYKVYIKLNINNSTSRVFSMDALYTADYKSEKIAEILKQYSAKKYGRNRKFVDAEIAARLGLITEEEAGATDAGAVAPTAEAGEAKAGESTE